jgi:hypothetical protein
VREIGRTIRPQLFIPILSAICFFLFDKAYDDYEKTVFAMVSFLLILTGYTMLYQVTRPDAPQLTVFLPEQKLLVKQEPEFLFYYFWEKKDIDWKKYNKVYVRR